MSHQKKILILGNFGYANHDLSGQTVKTRFMFQLFEKFYAGSLDYFDTQTLCKKRKIFKLLNKVVSCDKLVYLPAHGNLKYLFPVYFIMSFFFRFDICYSVIGGWLVGYLRNKPIHRWMLKRISVIFAETALMKKELESEYGFANVAVLYNFRITDFRPEIRCHQNLRLVFMARVDPQKGLDTIFNFCRYVDAMNPKPSITLDFYGQIDPAIKDTFLKTVESFDFVSYNGVLEPERIYTALQDYDLLLLPTHYYTEGLPGTVIESYMSGLPVIVSDWLHAREFVSHGNNGFIVPFENHQDEFNQSIMSLYADRGLLEVFKKNAIQQGRRFSGEYAWNLVSRYI